MAESPQPTADFCLQCYPNVKKVLRNQCEIKLFNENVTSLPDSCNLRLSILPAFTHSFVATNKALPSMRTRFLVFLKKRRNQIWEVAFALLFLLFLLILIEFA